MDNANPNSLQTALRWKAARLAYEAVTKGNPHKFESRGGWCAKFVRQVYEKALDLPPFSWPYTAPSAKLGAAKARTLAARGIGTLIHLDKDIEPGDIIYLENASPREFGHVVIYIGWLHSGNVRTVAENTLARRGGGPGLALTPYDTVRTQDRGPTLILRPGLERPV